MNREGPLTRLLARLQDFAARPAGAGFIGGLVVLIAAIVAVSAGWVGKDEKTTVIQSPLTQPAAKRTSSGLTVGQIYDRDGPGVVFVRAEIVQRVQSPFGFPQQQRGTATGAGLVIDKSGDILTNAHVVQGASKIEVGFNDKNTVNATLVGRDTSNDVALLKVNVSQNQLKPLQLGNSADARVGDPVIAIGNPFGLDRTVTSGIVSALQRQVKAPNGFTINNVIQTDAAINPGNSGGPLLDARGRVIGINSQIATAGGQGNIGIGFAVPINKAKQIADQLKKSGKVVHAFLGVSGVSITRSLADKLNLSTDKGALVQQASGPAAKAGIKAGDVQATVDGQDIAIGGDVIVGVDGKSVSSMDDVVNIVDSKKPGDKVSVELLRKNQKRTVTVTLGNRPQNLGSGGSETQPQLPLIP